MNEQAPARAKLIAALGGDVEVARSIEDLFRRLDEAEKRLAALEESDESE